MIPPRGTELLATLRHLDELLLPHLKREEDEAMPIVSEVLTEAEWRAIEHEHNVKAKGMAQLGREGHWLIDDASPEDRAKVVGLVPAVPRFVLLHGYGRSYRRRRDACWRPDAGERRVQKHGHNEVVVAASPDAVWDVVADVTRVGEWSHECTEVLVPRRRHPRRARRAVPGPQPSGHLPLGAGVRGTGRRTARARLADGAHDLLPRQHGLAHPRDTHGRRHPPRAELRGGPCPEDPRRGLCGDHPRPSRSRRRAHR